MSARIAAKFPSKETEFFNEDLFESQLKSAIDASLAEITSTSKRSNSLSPLTLNGYSNVASKQPQRSKTPNNTSWKVVQSNSR